jgi:hypothetical protein
MDALLYSGSLLDHFPRRQLLFGSPKASRFSVKPGDRPVIVFAAAKDLIMPVILRKSTVRLRELYHFRIELRPLFMSTVETVWTEE